MTPALIMAIALVGGDPSPREGDVRHKEALAGQIRQIIEREDVEGFIALLAPREIICGDTVIPTSHVAAELRKKKGFYALLFDTAALRASSASSVYPILSYREYFERAKDASPTIDREFNVIRWTSDSLGDVAFPPYFGVEVAAGRLRIGLIGAACH
jgi:hypothetical protein